MSFTKLPRRSPDDSTTNNDTPAHHSRLPESNSQNIKDRQRDGESRPSMSSNIKKNRKSVFREVGLAAEDHGAISPRVLLEEPIEFGNEAAGVATTAKSVSLDTESARVERGCTTAGLREALHSPAEADEEDEDEQNSSSAPPSPDDIRRLSQSTPTSPQSPAATGKTPWYAKLATGKRPRVRLGSGSSSPPSPFWSVSTMTMLALAVAVMAPTMLGRGGQEPGGGGVVDAGVIVHRAVSPTDVCARWAQQSKSILFLFEADVEELPDGELSARGVS